LTSDGFLLCKTVRQIFMVRHRHKLQTGNSAAQFSSKRESLRQNLSPLLHPTVSKGLLWNSNSPLPLLTPPPPRLPPAAHPPAAHFPSSSTSICSAFMCTAATPSATGSAASWTVSSHAANLFKLLALSSTQPPALPPLAQRCCTGTCTRQSWAGGSWAVLLSAQWSVMSVLWQCRQLYSTVVLPSCCVSLLSNSAFSKLLLTFLPPLLQLPTHYQACGHRLPWEVVLAAAGQAGPSSTDPGPHDPLSLIAGGHVALKFCSWEVETMSAPLELACWPLSHKVPDAARYFRFPAVSTNFIVIDGNVT